MYNKRQIGFQQEAAAKEYLKCRGYQIIMQNFSCRTGEIDIIAEEKSYLVFIEVKYRTNLNSGYPEEAVNTKKQRAIIKTARYYLLKYKISEDTPCRFDVIAILGDSIQLIQNAFEL